MSSLMYMPSMNDMKHKRELLRGNSGVPVGEGGRQRRLVGDKYEQIH